MVMSNKFPSGCTSGVRRWVRLLGAIIFLVLPVIGRSADAGAPVRYAVDAANSLVRIYVYSAGLLSFLGHDHVITIPMLDGELNYTPPPSQGAVFKLNTPVDALVVDDPEQRKSAGGRFSLPVPAKDRAGTRRNMLSEKVLDAAQYSEIAVTGHWLEGSPSHGKVAVTIGLHGAQRHYIVPVDIQMQNGGLVATGMFHLLQTEFGITPLSILGGALKVTDGLDVRFTLAFVPVHGS